MPSHIKVCGSHEASKLEPSTRDNDQMTYLNGCIPAYKGLKRHADIEVCMYNNLYVKSLGIAQLPPLCNLACMEIPLIYSELTKNLEKDL